MGICCTTNAFKGTEYNIMWENQISMIQKNWKLTLADDKYEMSNTMY